MFENLIEVLKNDPRKIVYTEGHDARILESAARLKKEGFLTPILVGNVDVVKEAAAKGGFDIDGLEILDPLTYEGMDAMVEEMVALRKGKMSAEDCRAALSKGNYFGTMLVKMGVADCLLGGATYSTADTVRPALQLVKTKKGANLVSSCFIMIRDDEMLAMGDCAINIDYQDKLDKEGNVVLSAAAQLAEVAVATAHTAEVFGIDPKVAMLSYSTADTVRPALQLVKTKKGAHLVSSCFIMIRGDETLAMGDCAINIDYQDTVDKEGNVTFTAAQKLAEVAIATAETAKVFGIDPKVAMLSYSTKGSGKGANVDLVRNATEEAKKLAPELKLDGEMQFDAAGSPVVGQLKFPGSPVAGYANTFIFPEIQSGNIGYKIAARLGGFAAYGPILQGLNAPINDLSRGCNAEEVYQMSIITAALK